MPVVVVLDGGPEVRPAGSCVWAGCGVEHEVVGRIVEHDPGPAKEVAQDDGETEKLLVGGKREVVLVLSGQDPCFVRRGGGEGRDGEEAPGVETDAFAKTKLLPDHVAE